MKMLCSIYKSLRKEGMYLYVEKNVDKNQAFKFVPDALLKTFGTPQHAFDLLLHAERPLARVDVLEVMDKIQAEGFYLQMPPPVEENLNAQLKPR